MGEHTASKTTFIAMMKLIYLPHFSVLGFAWTLKLPHTCRYTCLARRQMNILLLSTLKFLCAQTYTYIYVSKNCYLLTPCLNNKHMYTQICSNKTHLHSHNSCIRYTHEYITNYIQTFCYFVLFFLSLFSI